MDIVTFILLIFFLAFGVSIFFLFGLGIFSFFLAPAVEMFRVSMGLSKHQKDILYRNFSFYRNLNASQKKQFEKRLKYFLLNKIFIPRKMKEVTEEMKVLVGACAVQITFGYQPLKLAKFEKIVLYPSQYYSTWSKRNHKGEVLSSGVIVLSWEDFIKGYREPNDGYNLGLHEMAHALRLEDAFTDEEYAFIDEKSLKEWHRVSIKELKKIRNGEKTLLRRYAASSLDEFFAVSVEYFFEKPHELRQEMPQVYSALSKVLNQDPAGMMMAS